MKPSLLLQPLGVSAVAATVLSAAVHEPIANQISLDICQSSLLAPAPDVCSREGVDIWNDRNGTRRASGSENVWNQASPCYQNSAYEPEFCVYASPGFANNHGIVAVTTADRAAYLAKKTAFRRPESVRGANRDIVREADEGHDPELQPLGYNVVEMPGKGYGVVATRLLNRGDLIMSTTASILVDYDVFESAPETEANRLQAAGIGLLPEQHRMRFMNLSTHSHFDGDHEALVAKILATNAFDIEGDDGKGHGFFVVFPEISRMNHDCRPNADYHFDYDTLTQHIHAVRPIAAGEEITVSYIDMVMSRKQRRQRLHGTWGFSCSCSLCTQSRPLTKASDARIAQILELRAELQDDSAASRATPQMAELLISLYEQERLSAMLHEAYGYAAMEWNGAGEPWTAVKYARLAIEHGLFSLGARADDVREMRSLAADPWAHWSWMRRTSRRMRWGEEGQGDQPRP